MIMLHPLGILYRLKDRFSQVTGLHSTRVEESYSHDFEQRHGLTGLSQHYFYPGQRTAWEFSDYIGSYGGDVYRLYNSPFSLGVCRINPKIEQLKPIPPRLLQCLQKEWNALKALNPCLERTSFDTTNPRSLLDAMFGAGCSYNPDDINFFVTGHEKTGSRMARDTQAMVPGYNDLYDRANNLLGEDLEGVRAPETLQRIIDNLTARADPRPQP